MGLKKFVKKIGGVVKKVAPVALGAAGMYYGGKAFGSMLGGVTDGGATATQPSSAEANTLPRVEINGSKPSWLSQNAGSLVSGGLSLLGGYQANSANAKQAQNQMDFQREMSGTSYQRGTADMQAAGLNPMLAYSQGGASSPGGASASIEDAVTPALNSGRATAMMKGQLEQLRLSNENLEEQNAQIAAQTDLTGAQAAQVRSQTLGNSAEMERFRAAVDQMKASGKLSETQANQLLNMGPEQLKGLRYGNEAARLGLSGAQAESSMYELLGPLVPIIDKIPGVGSVVNSALSLRHRMKGTTSTETTKSVKRIGGLDIPTTTTKTRTQK
ncbi:MAG: DNA pilot protein [Microvirus sp.]|nr:MAG: DNA pilot protein [Microvirus sp.]